MPKIIENIKETILAHGRTMLLQEGYKGLNIRELSKLCDIAIGTFYNYFPNKLALATSIFQEDWMKTLNLAESLKYSNEPLKEKIRKIYHSLQVFVDDYMPIFYEIENTEGSSRSTSERDSILKLYTMVGELIQMEIDKDNLKTTLSSEKLSHLIMSNVMYLNKNKYMTFDELFEHLLL